MIRRYGIFILTLSFLAAGPAAAATCPDMAPATINGPAAASAKCQAAVSTSIAKFAKIKIKMRGKCIEKGVPQNCPDAKGEAKIVKIAAKSIEKIAKACDDAALTGLANSYNVGAGGGVDGTAMGQCVLGQVSVETDIVVGDSYGAPNNWFGTKERASCAKEIGKSSFKFVASALKSIGKCIDSNGSGADLGPVCVGSYSGGLFTAPTDAGVAAALSKLETKAEAGIDKKCGALSSAVIQSLFSCPGASTVDDIKNCVICNNTASMYAMLAAAYAETGTYIPNGPGAIQAAVDAAGTGDKLLIASGDYPEEVSIPGPTCGVTAIFPASPGDPCLTDADCGGVPLSCEPSAADGLALVGCGGATDEYPSISPSGGASSNGVFAAGVDGLLFQSLRVDNWDDNGMFVTDAVGLTFRDIQSDGMLNSTYALFPIRSDGVVIEACTIEGIIDAGLYVGQSENILLRYNNIFSGVASIEYENTADGVGYGNYMFGNTAGILVFKDPNLPDQDSDNHDVFANMILSNNLESHGLAIPGSIVATIPTGTGILMFSTDDAIIHHNRVQDNGSFGIALLDQSAINGLAAPDVVFPTLSADQRSERNKIRNNQFASNGNMPDTTPPNDTPLSSDIIFVLGEDTAGHENCIENNSAVAPIILTPVECP